MLLTPKSSYFHIPMPYLPVSSLLFLFLLLLEETAKFYSNSYERWWWINTSNFGIIPIFSKKWMELGIGDW
jgi:hypothetical protein